MKPSLHRRLNVAFIGLALGPLLLATLINGLLFFRHSLHSEAQHLREHASRMAEKAQQILQQGELALRSLNQYQDFLSLPAAVQQAQLLELLHRHDFLRELTLIGADGRERLHFSMQTLGRVGAGLDYVADPGFQAAVQRGAVHYGLVYQRPDGEPMLRLSLPMIELESGRVAAVLAAEVSLRPLREVVAKLALEPGTQVYVLGRTGLVVAHRNPSLVLRGTPFVPRSDALIQPGLDGRYALVVTEPAHIGRETMTVVAERHWREALGPALDGVVIVVGLMLLALALAWVASSFFLRRLVDPILEVEATAREITAGKLNQRVPVREDDEVGALARSFNTMTETLQRTLGQLQSEIAVREQAEAEVRMTQEMLALVIDAMPLYVFWKDRDSRYLGCNEQFAKAAGLTSAAEIVGKRDEDLVWREQAARYQADDAEVMASGVGKYRYIEPQATADGRLIWVETSKVPLHDASGAVTGVLGVYQDVTERLEAEERLRQAAAVFDNTQEGIMITDANGVILAVNKAFTEITGYSAEEAIGKTPRLLRSGRHDEAFYQRLWLSIRLYGGWQGEIWNRRKSGEIYPEWESVNAIKDANGQVVQYIAVFSDISQIKAAQEDIQRLAHYDALTGLPNHLLLRARLEHAMERAERDGQQVALLFLDLDRFKQVNDSLGHTLGDALLVEVAKRIREHLRREDTVARQGGDEFTVVLENVRDEEDAARLAAKLIQVLAEPFELRGHTLYIGASLGISLYPRDGRTVETLLANADAAMYRAKEAGRGHYQFYSQEMTAQAMERLMLEGQLRLALERNELRLHYQPQVELRSGSLVGLEVLVRWQHPQQGMIPPARFIPVAEDSGLIVPMGEWILREACLQGRRWLDEGLAFGRLSVNVAGPQIQRGNLVEVVKRALADSGLPAEHLELEITENFIMNQAERAIAQLHALRELGVSLAIDDFGTGYSSLAYLKSLPIGKLKIDQGFVRDLPADENDAAISRAVIALAQNLQFEVIAEGVETEAQRDFLLAHGCVLAQGYLYGRPVAADEVRVWLERRKAGLQT